MQADFWQDKYPSSVPFNINTEAYDSVLQVFSEAVHRYGKPLGLQALAVYGGAGIEPLTSCERRLRAAVAELPPEFVWATQSIKMRGAVAKVHLLTDGNHGLPATGSASPRSNGICGLRPYKMRNP